MSAEVAGSVAAMAGETSATAVDLAALTRDLRDAGVRGLQIVWIDNAGVPRARIVPLGRLEAAARTGVGITTLSAVFDSHDGITFEHPGLATPSGDVRLLPVSDRIVQLAGQPHLAWAPGHVVDERGDRWAYDPRGALEAEVRRAAARGIEVRAGWEVEFFVGPAGEELRPGHSGPAYSAEALTAVDGLVNLLLADLAGNGLEIGQLHAEYGFSQMELSLPAADPLRAADDQLLARQTIRAAARANGLRVSFAPLLTATGVGQGWHIHTSVWRDGRNVMSGDGAHGLSAEGAGWIAGLLRDLPALAAVAAPSVPSLTRVRPGYFAGAYAFWGIQNREAPLRFVPSTPFLGADHANVELKVSDASANPYLALAALLAAGRAGIEERLQLEEPLQEDPGTWSEDRRQAAGLLRLPSTPEEQERALTSGRIADALGPERLGAFLAVRRADAAWAAERELEEVVEAHRWRY